MKTLVSAFPQDDTGSTAIEYALLAGLMGVGIISNLDTIKGALDSIFNSSATSLNTAVN